MTTTFIEPIRGISSLTHWYQPIYQLTTGNIFGYEALMRANLRNNINPTKIFRQALVSGNLVELDTISILKAYKVFKSMFKDYIFLNIFPSTILEEGFLNWWDNHFSSTSKIVLELSEEEPVGNWSTLRTILDELKQREVKIALDDLGSGCSFLKHWIELNPDFIKIDRYYIDGLNKSIVKQRVMEHLIKIIDDSATIIIEGVEDIESLKIVMEYGIEYAQGYALGTPCPLDKIRNNRLDIFNENCDFPDFNTYPYYI